MTRVTFLFSNTKISIKSNQYSTVKSERCLLLSTKCSKFKFNDNTILSLYGGVDDNIADLIFKKALFTKSVDNNKELTLLINSPGGSVTAGLKIMDALNYVKVRNNTVCLALAASMGAFLLASGSRNYRQALLNSRIMIHQPLGGAFGDSLGVEIQANEILYFKLVLSGYLSDFCRKPLNEILVDTDRDYFMSSKQATNYGLIDKILK